MGLPMFLEISGIKKHFGEGESRVDVLKGIDAQIEKGEICVLLGPSGSGKSTLLNIIGGIDNPDSGYISINGERTADMNEKALTLYRRKHLGYIFQMYNLIPNLNIKENIEVGAYLSDNPLDVDSLLKSLGLYEHRHKLPNQLSGGQQQRCALARILASEPTAILLDEPFSALDSYLKYQLELELAETLSGFPGTVLWVSHDRGEVFRNCRRVCVIDRGRSQPVTTLGELFRSPGTEAAARLSGCKNYADARPREDAVFLPDWGLTLSCGRPVPEGVCRIGIRAHHVQLAGPGAENAFSCTAVKVVEDVFSTIVLLRPEGAAPEAPLLRMELDKDNWQAVPDKDRLTVSVPPEAILLLES